MINGIEGIVTAVGNGPVSHIDGVLSALRYVGHPFGNALFSFLDGLYGAERSFFEGVFELDVLRTEVCEPFSVALGPCFVCGTFGIRGACAGAAVVVDDDFGSLAVALTRHQYVGSGIFQHRDEVGEYEALRVQVFHGLEATGTLPLPAVEFRLVVEAVALPQGYVAVLQTVGGGIGFGKPGH